MKTFLFIPAVLALTLKLSAGETNHPALLKIGTADAASHYDQEMIVTGKVAQVTIRPAVTFLNLDKPFPNSPFSVVIFHGHSSFYGDANALKGKSIEIKGKIKNYQDKPEIALDSTNQLTVFDSKGMNITSAILQTTNRAPVMPQSPNAVPVPPVAQTNRFPKSCDGRSRRAAAREESGQFIVPRPHAASQLDVQLRMWLLIHQATVVCNRSNPSHVGLAVMHSDLQNLTTFKNCSCSSLFFAWAGQ